MWVEYDPDDDFYYEPTNTGYFTIQTPEGVVEEIYNLSKYCRSKGLNIGHLHETMTGLRNHTGGYSIIPQCPLLVKVREEIRHHRENSGPRRARKGEKNGRAILNKEQVEEIRKLHKKGTHKVREIASLYGCSKANIERILYRKSWA